MDNAEIVQSAAAVAASEEANRRIEIITTYLSGVREQLREAELSLAKNQERADELRKILSDADKGILDVKKIPPVLAINEGLHQVTINTRDFVAGWSASNK